MLQELLPLLGTDAIDILAAEAHRREAQKPGGVHRRLRARHESGLQRAVLQLQRLDASPVVATVPLDVDRAVLSDRLAERRGVFLSGALGDFADQGQPGGRPGVLEEHRASPRRDDQHLAVQRHVPRRDEMILPGDAAFCVLRPVRPVPAVPLEVEDLADEVPGPRDRAVGLDRVRLGAERDEVGAPVAGDRRREDRVAAVDLADDPARRPVQDAVIARHRPEVEVRADDGGGRDVVAVSGAAAGRRLPEDRERGRVDREGDSRAVDGVDASVRDHGRREDGVAERHGANKAERGRHGAIGDVAGVAGIAFELEPVVAGEQNGKDDRDHERFPPTLLTVPGEHF